MRNKIVTMAVFVFITGSMFIGCQSSAQKVENAEDNVNKAKDDLVEAKSYLNDVRQDSITEFQLFKKESEAKIALHEKNIADLKARIESEKKENKAKYEKKLAELEKKNNDMKKKLADYKETSKDKWDVFKAEFNSDMEKLGKAFNDFTVNNKK